MPRASNCSWKCRSRDCAAQTWWGVHSCEQQVANIRIQKAGCADPHDVAAYGAQCDLVDTIVLDAGGNWRMLGQDCQMSFVEIAGNLVIVAVHAVERRSFGQAAL